MTLLNNRFTLAMTRLLFVMATRSHKLGVERLPDNHRGLLLACGHLSHYDPFCVSVLLGREVDWMSRIEFFQTPVSAWFVRRVGGFSIDRSGHALPGMKEGLRRIRRGRIVGVYPEGEVVRGAESVFNGGPLKQGTALLSRRAQIPIGPCVMLGSYQFSRVVPWLPLRSARLWIGFGHPIEPNLELPPGRASRRELTRRLADAMRELYGEMLEAFDVAPEAKP